MRCAIYFCLWGCCRQAAARNARNTHTHAFKQTHTHIHRQQRRTPEFLYTYSRYYTHTLRCISYGILLGLPSVLRNQTNIHRFYADAKTLSRSTKFTVCRGTGGYIVLIVHFGFPFDDARVLLCSDRTGHYVPAGGVGSRRVCVLLCCLCVDAIVCQGGFWLHTGIFHTIPIQSRRFAAVCTQVPQAQCVVWGAAEDGIQMAERMN